MFIEEKLTVTSVAVFKYEFEKKKSVFVPGRSCHALTFRIGGKVSIECPGKSFISQQGSLTYIPKAVSYSTEILESGSAYGIHFTLAEEYENLLPELFLPSRPVTFENLYSELAAKSKAGNENDLYSMSLFYGILAEVRREYMKKHGKFMSPRIKTAKERIDRDFSDTALSVSSLAQDAGISEVYFRREFSSAVGTTPAAYIKNVRIENAKAYLRTGLFSVTEVALKCGFDSISYFSHEFHRATGLTPREYIIKFS